MLTDPWLVLLFEPLHGVTYACLQMASVAYTARVSPPHLTASAQSVQGSITWAFGPACGALLGGFVMQNYGARVLYRAASGLSVSWCAMFAVCFRMPPVAPSSLTEAERESSIQAEELAHSSLLMLDA